MRNYFIALGRDCCGDIFYGIKETIEAAQACQSPGYVVAVEEWSGPPFEMVRRWEERDGQWRQVHPKREGERA